MKYIIFLCALFLASCVNQQDFPERENIPIYGRVIAGKKEARTLGYPTANILTYNSDQLNQVKEGVHACVIRDEKKSYPGMCYFDKKREGMIEAHLYDFKGNLYEKNLSIVLTSFVRAPVKVSSLDELKTLLDSDAKRCRELSRY